jgi:gamma-glutamyl hydrolase
VYFPGGGMDLNISERWTANAKVILDFAQKENDAGRVFPLWGTCLGHQLLSYLTANYDVNVIQKVDGQ